MIARVRRTIPGVVMARVMLSLLVVASMVLLGAPAARAANPGGALPNGITVSWLPTSQPAKIVLGQATTSTFWVTNNATKTIPIDILPAVALPGNNGTLKVSPGADPRFPSITFTPSKFNAKPDSTTEVKTTIISPVDLPAGTYLLPAIVEPQNLDESGNLHIERSIVALTTFQLPGKLDISMEAKLLSPTARQGTLTRKLPKLPLIEIGTSVQTTLRITSHSASGVFAYYEITGRHTLLGKLKFDGHAPGIDNDVRGESSLYFHGLHRDIPVRWASGAAGAGRYTLEATVSFNPEPNQVSSIGTSMTMFVISPWWLAAVIALLLVCALLAVTHTRRLSHKPHARRRDAPSSNSPSVTTQVIVGVLLSVTALVAGALSTFWTLGALVVVGALALGGIALRARGWELAEAVRRALLFHRLAVVLVVAGAGALVATFAVKLSPGYALAGVSAAALWLLAGWWLHLWVAKHGQPHLPHRRPRD